MDKHKPFSEISFGKTRAEEESSEAPGLLIQGYFDNNDTIDRAVSGSSFLVLGPKGAGKSAVGQKIDLASKRYSSLFARVVFLEDFPFRSFAKIGLGSSSASGKYPESWSLLILTQLVSLLREDEGAESRDSLDFLRAVVALEEAGFLPATSLKESTIKASKTSFKIKLSSIIEAAFEEEPTTDSDLAFLHLTNNLKTICGHFKSESNHVLIIDGLDDVLSGKELQLQAIASLIFESSRLNDYFRSKGAPLKIVILCRTDLYEKLPGPNKNKIRQDNSIDLDWYKNVREKDSSDLLSLVNLRSSLSNGFDTNLFDTYFPHRINGIDCIKYILDMTRHTPRDIISLMNHIKLVSNKGSIKLSTDNILAGLRNYSIKYFLPEIKDELAGYVNPNDSDLVLRSLAGMGKRDFSMTELEEHISSLPQSLGSSLFNVMDELFNCSAIGNKQSRENERNFFSFKFRNHNTSFNPASRIIIHRGLFKALNLI